MEGQAGTRCPTWQGRVATRLETLKLGSSARVSARRFRRCSPATSSHSQELTSLRPAGRAPDRVAISPRVNSGANPCRPMFGQPTAHSMWRGNTLVGLILGKSLNFHVYTVPRSFEFTVNMKKNGRLIMFKSRLIMNK